MGNKPEAIRARWPAVKTWQRLPAYQGENGDPTQGHDSDTAKLL